MTIQAPAWSLGAVLALLVLIVSAILLICKLLGVLSLDPIDTALAVLVAVLALARLT